MKDLKEIREKINVLDGQIARLFEERMEAVGQVAQYKKAHGIAISDKKREEEVLSQGLPLIQNEALRDAYKEFMKNTMKLSVKYQRELLQRDEDLLENVIIKRGALKNIRSYFNLDRKVLVVTDDGVPEQYAKTVCDLCGQGVLITMKQGEDLKTLKNFQYLCEVMLEHSFTKDDCVVAVGGGVVGDLTGFAAASYMRGIDFYNIPTTLLAQVDASVGGKSAVNLGGIKNMVGTVREPRGVLIDPDVLSTLDKRQIACGAAEIIKIAAVFDEELFCIIEKKGISQAGADLEEIIKRAVAIKLRVVSEDPKDENIRRALNFGHTLGHGIESAGGFLHGEAIALGMIPMCNGAVRERLKKVLRKEDLPVKCDGIGHKITEAVLHDKKIKGKEIVTVRVEEMGKFSFRKVLPKDLLREYEEAFQ